MKTAIITIAIGQNHQSLAKLTHPTLEAYAKRIGADFIVIDQQQISQTTPHFEKFQIYYYLNVYHRIIYMDTDLIVREDCPNLFDIVPEDKLGAFNEGRFADRSGAIQAIKQQYNVQLNWDNDYYNTGVLVISRCHKHLFVKPMNEISNFYEQSFLNLMFKKSKVEIFELEYNFNRMTVLDFVGKHRLASYIVHYAGCPNIGTVFNLVEKDLASWRSNLSDYPFNINVQVHGGLGDQICAEPVIRYIIEKAYPDARIHVTTWYPRAFMHLPVPVYDMGTFKPKDDTSYYEIHTMAKHGCPSWRYVSPNQMHTTDYSSVMSLRGTIPNDCKHIKLKVLKEDYEELEKVVGSDLDFDNCVLVHAGRGWPSKTFPKEYWEEVVRELSKVGRVILIGKHISDEQGVVKLDNIPSDVINTINLLSLGGIFALVSKAKVLLTNDSAPVHIAGAFDNYIALIPTCKAPDHVIPYRYGHQTYKSASLYKRLVCADIDSRPTMVHGQDIDWVNGDIMDYLPEVDVVCNEIRNMLNDWN